MSKIERLESNIQRALTEIISREVKDNKMGFVTITALHLTNDLSFLTVYFTVLGSKNHQDSVTKTLERAKGFIKKQLAHKVQMRKVPDIIFKYDDSLERGNKIEEIIDDIQKK